MRCCSPNWSAAPVPTKARSGCSAGLSPSSSSASSGTAGAATSRPSSKPNVPGRDRRSRADEERLWGTRELHDSLTHSISVVNVQAGVVLHLLDHLPDQARDSFHAVREAGHEPMRELRATLGVLRRADDDSGAPGLARLPELVYRAGSAGLPVTVQVSGEPHSVPAGVDHAAYRIVQEALTNVLRHAGLAPVTVHLGHCVQRFTLTVDDDGNGGQARAGDWQWARRHAGARRLRWRAAERRPRPGGGFWVRAEFPWRSGSSSPTISH